MTQYCCTFCDKKFHYKEFYDNHRIACEFFSRNRKQRLREIDGYEIMPTQEEMFHLLQHLTFKCQTLTEEVDKLKKSVFSSRKKTTEMILDSVKPTLSFEEWNKCFKINHKCITEIFNGTLTDGIISCIKDRINEIGIVLPIQSFKEKQGTIHIFEEDEETQLCKWNICSNDKLSFMIEIIIHEIGRFYCIWKEEQTNIDTDTELSYMVKISGIKINKNKQLHDVKTWILQNIVPNN